MARNRALSGLTPQREQQYQERETEKLSRRMERGFYRSIAKAMRRIGEAHGNPGNQALAMLEHRRELATLLARYYDRAFDKFGSRVLRDGAKAHPLKWETKEAEDDFDRARRLWIEANVADKVTPIAGTTEKQAKRIINRVVAEAVTEGLGQAGTGNLIMKAIAKEGGILARGRSRVIARTETHSSANAASQEAAKATGLDLVKEWVSSRGPRTREDHAEADGQIVELSQPFIVGGEELMYPGDPRGSAANIINCRCASIHTVRE